MNFRKTKHLVFVNDFLSLGGINVFISSLVRLIKKKYATQFECTLVVGKKRKEVQPRLLRDDFLKKELFFLKFNKRWQRLLEIPIAAFWTSFRLHGRKKIDCLILNNTKSSFLIAPWARIKHIPALLHCHNIPAQDIYFNDIERLNGFKKLKAILRAFCLWVMQAWVIFWVKRIIVFSRFQKKQLSRFFPLCWNKIIISRFGVDTRFFRPSNNRSALKKKIGFSSSELLVFYLGRFEPNKGLSLFLESLKRLKGLGLPMRVIIAGPEDEFLPQIKKQVVRLKLKNVIFLGKLEGKKKIAFLQAADLLVIPSVGVETFSLTALEALSCGTPVVANPVGGIEEILSRVGRRWGNGRFLITQKTTPLAFSRTTTQVLKLGSRQRKHLRKICRQTIVIDFDLDKKGEKLIKLY
ncbi:hypothetical protein COT75_01110 [Candidatus Beckwithbacteria bacterium CG10_big_fil_rev_8_21_14_0_10_34_10]|uniref:Glycosyl transferase family 1 domain-containing protein n=1 Tax=Candidatus Beckwithbacteria bacterium CG10_big_fil_rev_8_21_14_0_10_34_10 TaxID=1974495 RepID=A0A2H0WA20_9BACT|nr:MAG: hypothetical protein COT75_01110 [Candidatus Beckwithbacteria bacterium CG10_big_fil_rev_8_21_14_0_10_34_10]